MISTVKNVTGAAGAMPSPAARVSASVQNGASWMAPTVAPSQGTGLPCTGTGRLARPWAPSPAVRFTGAGAQHRTDPAGTDARTAGYAERTTSSTPGAQLRRDRLS